MKFGKKKRGVSKDETPLAPGKPRPYDRAKEGRGTCRACLVKDGHAGWCPRVS